MRFIFLVLSLFLCLLNAQARADIYVRNLAASAAEETSGVGCFRNGDGTAASCAASENGPGAYRGFTGLSGATLTAGMIVHICDMVDVSVSGASYGASMETGTAAAPIILDGSFLYCAFHGDGAVDKDGVVRGGFDAKSVGNFTAQVTTSGPSYYTWRNLVFRNSVQDAINFNLAAGTGYRIENSTARHCGTSCIDGDKLAPNSLVVEDFYGEDSGQDMIQCGNDATGTGAGSVFRNLKLVRPGSLNADPASNTDGISIQDYCGTNTVVDHAECYDQRGTSGACFDANDSLGTGSMVMTRLYADQCAGACLTTTTSYNSGSSVGALQVTVNGAILRRGRFNVYEKDNDPLHPHQLFNISASDATSTNLKIGDSGTSGDSGALIIRNSVFSNAADQTVANAYFRNGASWSLTMTNNRYASGSLYTLASGGNTDLAGWQSGTGTDSDAEEVSPGWVGGVSPTTAEGFRLKVDSPLRRAGKDLNLGNIQDAGNRAFAHPPSIGAWEAASGDIASTRTTASTRTNSYK